MFDILQTFKGKCQFYGFVCCMLLFGCKTTQPSSSSENKSIADSVALITKEAIVDSAKTAVVYSQDITYKSADEKLHDLIHTKLEVSFDWEKQQLLGTATLELKPYFYKKDVLILDAKGFDIEHVNLVTGEIKKPLTYEYDGKIIVIDLEKDYQSGEHFFVEIKYVAKPAALKSEGSEAITDNRGLYFVNTTIGGKESKQIWTQGQTEANSVWFPTIDTPNEKNTTELFITVANKFKTVSNGTLIYSLINEDGTRTDYWKMEQPHSPYLTMMAVGEFVKVQDQWKRGEGDQIEVNYYVDSTYAPYAKSTFGNTPEMLDFFSKLFNYPYPWSKYDQVVVHDFVSGAMENTTASVFMEELHVTDRELLDFHWDDIIAHELIHHWFGNLVTCESWSNLPLNEAFATYGEYLWYEHKYGIEEAEYLAWEAQATYLEEAKEKREKLIRYTYEDKEDLFDHHSYEKGSRVLHMLRNYVGDDAFFQSLHHYLKKHAYNTAEIHDLRMAFEVGTGEDLNWFFNQWFLSSGHPILEVSHEQQGDSLTVEIFQRQDFDTTPVYKLPSTLGIWLGENDFTEYPIELLASYQKFVFEVKDSVKLVLFDPDKQLLAEVIHAKTPDEYIFQYYNGGSLITRYEALESLAELAYENDEFYEILSQVFLSALHDPHWALRELAVDFFYAYEGKSMSLLVKELKNLASKDKKPQVRGSAISTLASIDSIKYGPFFKERLNDMSYLVQGAALLAFAQSTAGEVDAVMNRYADSTNTHVVFALAEYYSANNKSDKNDWFVRQLDNADDEDTFYLIQYYGLLLSKSPQEVVDAGTPKLVELAKGGKKEYVRLAAFQSLLLLPESEQLTTLKREIMAEEKSEKLLEYYEALKE